MEYSQEKIEQALRPVLLKKGIPAPRFAVTIPILCTGNGPELLVEVRAAGISQAGDPCFPGGHIERGETPAQAAVRELAEELSIYITEDRLLGQVDTVETPLGVQTDVFVCTLSEEDIQTEKSNPDEVAVLLRVPMQFFLERPDAWSYTVDGHTIWGMTAGAIRNLLERWRMAGLN